MGVIAPEFSPRTGDACDVDCTTASSELFMKNEFWYHFLDHQGLVDGLADSRPSDALTGTGGTKPHASRILIPQPTEVKGNIRMIPPEQQAEQDRASLSRSVGRGKVKFEVYGEELVEKEVGQSGNSGRVYLPQDWVGKRVKIIRMD